MALHDARVFFPGELDRTDAEKDPMSYPIRVLAEGDSWFSFGAWKLHSLLNHVRTKRPACIVTLAHPGETISRMADIEGNPELDLWLSRPYNDIPWNAVLISGGGNDVIDDALAGRIIPSSSVPQPLKLPEDYLDLAALDATLDAIRGSYAAIVALRDRPQSPCVGAPLITHTYDLVTPRNAPAQFLVPLMGPWLYTALVNARVPEARWNAVSDYILGALGQAIEQLEQALPGFFVVRAQGTLDRAAPGTTKNSRDWENEIHPNRGGYRKIARLVSEYLDALA